MVETHSHLAPGLEAHLDSWHGSTKQLTTPHTVGKNIMIQCIYTHICGQRLFRLLGLVSAAQSDLGVYMYLYIRASTIH